MALTTKYMKTRSYGFLFWLLLFMTAIFPLNSTETSSPDSFVWIKGRLGTGSASATINIHIICSELIVGDWSEFKSGTVIKGSMDSGALKVALPAIAPEISPGKTNSIIVLCKVKKVNGSYSEIVEIYFNIPNALPSKKNNESEK
jgi:hypothetical protein